MDDSGDFNPHQINWDDEKTNRIWDFYSTSVSHKSTYFGETVGPHVARVIKRKGLLKKRTRIVDFSCGTGALIESLLQVAPDDVTVKGVDPSHNSVQVTNVRNKDDARFIGAVSLQEAGLLNESSDLVILTEVVEHLDDASLSRVIDEAWRILSPAGALVITTPNEEDLERGKVLCPECGCIFHRWQHQRSWSVPSLCHFLGEKGFDGSRGWAVTWGNELVDVAFKIFRKKPTGILVIARKPR